MKAIKLRLVVLTVLAFVLSARQVLAEEFVVSAAASLTGVMAELKKAFEATHPQWTLFVNLASSGRLLQQIEAGAPVDVFAPADQETMDRAQQRGFTDPATRIDFTANDLMLVVPADSAVIHSPRDLADPRVGRVALGEPDAVPAGSYTKDALERLGLWSRLEPRMVYGLSVKQALDYAALGEVDAAFVYATDAKLAHPRVRVVATMQGHKPIIYPAAIIATSKHKDAARAFLAFLVGYDGQAILHGCGFKCLPYIGKK